jgi:hypothetical protein
MYINKSMFPLRSTGIVRLGSFDKDNPIWRAKWKFSKLKYSLQQFFNQTINVHQQFLDQFTSTSRTWLSQEKMGIHPTWKFPARSLCKVCCSGSSQFNSFWHFRSWTSANIVAHVIQILDPYLHMQTLASIDPMLLSNYQRVTHKK